jgi:dUTP pyrophosphatase
MNIKLKIKKLTSDAFTPKYATDGAAAFDLHAINLPPDGSVITAGSPVVLHTGLSFEIPHGWVMLVNSRSGHGFKNDVRLANCQGVIDSDYRGEVMVKLSADQKPFTVHNGDRIAQAMILQCPQVEFEEVEELSNTERGAGGFGSTDKK